MRTSTTPPRPPGQEDGAGAAPARARSSAPGSSAPAATSGAATPDAAAFELLDAAFEIAPRRARLLSDAAGAYASFEGWVRDHNDGRPVDGLHYEAYATLARAEGRRIVEEAAARFAITGVHCVHRTGALAVGELAVWVGVSAGHRDAAFAACRFVIDEVKARVPIWKHERYTDGAPQWLHPAGDTDGPATGADGDIDRDIDARS